MRNLARRGRHRLLWPVLSLCCAAAAPAAAETLLVTHTGDSGAGSLRQAMLDAMASTEASTITFAPTADGVITLASPLPELLASGGDLAITGNGAAATIIDGAGAHRPFFAQNATGLNFALRQLTVRNGRAGGSTLNGGAIHFSGASLSVEGVDFSGNRSTSGSGGAIYASAAVTFENSVFAANRANMGGAFEVWDGPLLVRNTTVAGTEGNNTVIVFGGGAAARARLVNATVVDNQARGLQLRMNATLSITNSLLAGNGAYDIGTTDSATVDLATSFNNVIGVQSGAALADGVNGNRIGVTEARVGPLGDYGGATRTVALLPGSPALNAGAANGQDIPATDARGLARVGTPDVGAFESRGFTLTRVGGSGQSAVVNTAFADPLVVQVVAVDGGEPVAGGRVDFAGPASGAGALLTPSAIGSDGRAQATAVANDVVGGPYTVTAVAANGDGPALGADFSLSNVDGSCAAFVFPYTLAGADNAARVAELRQAIECANLNASDDVIDLDDNALVFGDAPYTDANGADALPVVTGVLTLRNGALERDASAPPFRFLDVAAGGDLTVHAMQLRNGSADTEGGAIRADGVLLVKASLFEDNRAATRGGAIATHAGTTLVTSRFERNAAVDGAAIAGGDADAIPGGDVTLVAQSRFEDNGDGDSRSVIWNKSYFAMVGSLVAGNQLSAAGSSLLFFHDDTAVAEMRNVTIAGNAVQGELLSRPSANVQLHNGIVWDNQYGSLGNVSPTHSIVPGVPAVNGNLDQPPGFVGTPGDYRLDAGSPAIDAGDNGYGFTDAFDADEDGDTDEMAPDLDLNPRPFDDAGVTDTGNGDAPLIDMGAYEYQTASVAAGIAVSPTGGLVTTEAGGTATFTIVLERYPAADVSVTLSSSDPTEGLVAPAGLTFTQADWNQPRTVTVSGLDDGVVDGDQAYTVVIAPASSADPAYAGIDPPDVAVVNEEGEIPPHHIGGTVIGLLGDGLVLSLDGTGETLPIAANGRFDFTTALAPGAAYSVTVAAQPQSPAQDCVVVNGSGTMGAVDVDNVVVNCGASTAYAIGGTVSGLAGGGLVLQLNGGGDLAVSADGAYAFLPRLADGASYVVTVKTQPPGQLCTLANATGTVQGADVTDVDASCAPLQAQLHLDVDDGHEFARYGQVRDYFVTLGNSGNVAADGVALVGAFSAAFDVANVQWQCLGGASLCGSAGAGGFADTANLPANSSVTWIVSVPVLAGSTEDQATFTVDLPSGLSDADTDTLVIFRDGLDVPYADGTQAVEPLPPLESVPIPWPPARGDGIAVVRALRTPAGGVEVQRLAFGGADFVRLLGTDRAGRQHASAWARVAAGARLVVGRAVDAQDTSIVLLEGAERPFALAQDTNEDTGETQ
ncbi:choice-of-anchor Q domain-containing protein [Dokdonella ginsengisoli]|uniref:Choice-of-anchor Q domain-containing protein n=1 Tax=Dokdonella ginsengisoli TaxID=363846 RepID=A0ABV9QX55_9GAMM